MTAAPMTEAEAIRYTEDLLAEHGVTDVTVHVNPRLTKTYGRCMSPRYSLARRIEISGPLMAANPYEVTAEVCRHEVAHAIAGIDAGHGPRWRAACAQVGAKPRRCYRPDEVTPAASARWEGRCSACGQVVGHKVRRTRNARQTYHRASACPSSAPLHRRTIIWLDRHAEDESPEYAAAAATPKEADMAGKYTITLTHPDGSTESAERARKQDAIRYGDTAIAKDGFVAYEVRTPGGDLVHTAAAPAQDAPKAGRPVAPRIPEDATEWVCEGCARTLPVTKYPTTAKGGRRTECRGCRDARRKGGR